MGEHVTRHAAEHVYHSTRRFARKLAQPVSPYSAASATCLTRSHARTIVCSHGNWHRKAGLDSLAFGGKCACVFWTYATNSLTSLRQLSSRYRWGLRIFIATEEQLTLDSRISCVRFCPKRKVHILFMVSTSHCALIYLLSWFYKPQHRREREVATDLLPGRSLLDG